MGSPRLDGAAAGTTAARDDARILWRALPAVVAVVVLVVVVIAVISVRDVTARVLERDRATAAALAAIVDGLPPAQRSTALVPLGADGTVALLTADDILVPRDLGTGSDGPLWRRWTGLVARTSKVRTAFTTTDPDGVAWSHVAVPTADDGRLLVQRPKPASSAVQHAVLRGFAATGASLTLLFALIWLAAGRGFLGPLGRVIDASEDLRWRGQLRDDDHARLSALAHREDAVGRLAGNMLAVDADITHRFLQLSTLLETNRIVAASLELQEVLDNILRQINHLFSVERCAVLSLDERANVFVVRASLGLSDQFVRDLRVSPTEPDSPAMRALRSRQPVQIADTAVDRSFAEFRQRSSREGFGSVLAIPFATTVAPPAVLLLYTAAPYRYSYSDLELASSFAGFASLAMENAALYGRIDERLQEQTSRLEAIVESLDDGLILADLDGDIAYHNRAAAELLRLDADALIGARIDGVIARLGAPGSSPAVMTSGRTTPAVAASATGQASASATGPASASASATASATASASASAGSAVVTTRAGGNRRDLRVRSFLVTDRHGASLGQGQLWQDVTEDHAVERMKSALLATVSHELRAPLANLKGYVSTLLAEDVRWEPAEQREFLATISTESDRLEGLVRDVLDMSRIEADMVTLTREPVRPAELLDRVVTGLPADRRQRVRVTVAPDLPPVELDRVRIEIAIHNLVDNALKFSSADSPVDVDARCGDGALVVTVRDRGPGVPADLRERIFDNFVRGDDGLARAAGGFGLGLAICRGFVQAHGGQVWMQMARPGTRFGLTVPLDEGGLR
ncbi:MAG TPA: ATP-binding protein [Euzebya sp.]|nr:ATP-binding protein [Euzebya sp.]